MLGLYWLQFISFVFAHHVWHLTVVGVSRMMNATFGTGPYLQSWIVFSNSSFNGAPFAQTLVSNEEYGPLLAFCPLSLFDLCPAVCWFWLHKCCLPTFLMLIESQIVIVFSTYFICCSSMTYNVGNPGTGSRRTKTFFCW